MGKSHDLATIAADGLSTLKADTVKVDTIQNTSGTGALTIDSGGTLFKTQKVGFYARGYAGYVNKSSTHTNLHVWYYTNVDFNNGNHFTNSSSTGAVFVAPKAGVYLISGGMGYKSGVGYHGLMYYKNTTNIIREWSYNSFRHDSQTFTVTDQLAVNDELRLGSHLGYSYPASDDFYCGFRVQLLF